MTVTGMNGTHVSIGEVTAVLQAWAEHRGPPTRPLRADEAAAFVARRALLRLLQLYDPADPTPERTLRYALSRVPAGDRRRFCLLVAEWLGSLAPGEIVLNPARTRRLPPAIRTLVPTHPPPAL